MRRAATSGDGMHRADGPFKQRRDVEQRAEFRQPTRLSSTRHQPRDTTQEAGGTFERMEFRGRSITHRLTRGTQ